MTNNFKWDKFLNIFAGLACFGLIAFYLYYFYLALSSGHYYPPRSDHVGYYMEIKSFLETGSLATSAFYDAGVSKIGEFGAHGFIYSLFYGLISKIFGFNYSITIWTHFVLFLTMLAMIFKNTILNFNQKLLFLAVQLSFFTVFFASFSHYPEFLHIFFANLMGLFVLNIFDQYSKQKDINSSIYILFLMILIMTIFRISWSLFAFGLLAFARDRKDFIKYSILAVLSFAFAVFFRENFCASYDAVGIGQVSKSLHEGDFIKPIFIMIDNFKETASMYFYKYYFSLSLFSSKIFAFVTFLMTLYYGIKKKNQFCLFIAIVLGIFFTALFLTFDAFDGRDIKGIAAPYIISMLALIVLNKRLVLTVILIVSLIALPETYRIFRYIIFDQCMVSGQLFPQYNYEILRKLKSNGKNVITILVDDNMFGVLMAGRPPNIKNVLSTPKLALPYKNLEGKRIRYMFLTDDAKRQSRQLEYIKKAGVDYEIDARTGRLIAFPSSSQK